MSGPNDSEDRKRQHVQICSTRDICCRCNFWDDIHLVHNSTPEVDFDDIDTSINLFGKKFSAPLLIAGMTGGFPEAEKINGNLAKAASELQVGMGVGSQRGAMEKPSLIRSFSVVKEYDVPLRLANIGAPQLVGAGGYKQASDILTEVIDMIDADAVAVHLNYLQEIVQI